MSQSTTGQQLDPAPTGSTIIKIATDLPVSGKDTSAGKPAENGAHLAVDQANANHSIAGYTLVFEPKDDVGPSGMHDPAVGARNVTAFVADALVAGIVGPFNSWVARAELPITNQAPLAQISPASTDPCLSKEIREFTGECQYHVRSPCSRDSRLAHDRTDDNRQWQHWLSGHCRGRRRCPNHRC